MEEKGRVVQWNKGILVRLAKTPLPGWGPAVRSRAWDREDLEPLCSPERSPIHVLVHPGDLYLHLPQNRLPRLNMALESHKTPLSSVPNWRLYPAYSSQRSIILPIWNWLLSLGQGLSATIFSLLIMSSILTPNPGWSLTLLKNSYLAVYSTNPSDMPR